jgi:hypothetical protein
MSAFEFPDPQDPTWPDYRNYALRQMYPRLAQMLKIQLLWFQAEWLLPPVDLKTLRFIQKAGAKRIGKSWDAGFSISPYALMPGAQVRLYGPQTENCEREFSHLKWFLFEAPNALAKYWPFLKERLTAYNEEPNKGPLTMRWDYGTHIRSHTYKERGAWVGEPIDLGVICEPGLFPSIRVYTKYIKPNLQDRSGLCRSAGTVDNPWMHDMHNLCSHSSRGHFSPTEYWREDITPDPNAEQYCVCQLPRWENTTLELDPETIRKTLAFEMDESIRDVAINWLGMWEMYSDVAYDKWDAEKMVEIVPDDTWKKLKAGKAGWDSFATMDTGKHKALGEYVVNPQGMVLRIDEFSNYEYRAGQIHRTDTRGLRQWFHDICADWQHHTPKGKDWERIIYGDPATQDKEDVTGMGCGWSNAINDHSVGVDRVNEYLSSNQFKIIKPASRGHIKTNLETELPRVRWQEKERGVAGRPQLIRGDDHQADELRYGLASRPLAQEYLPERKEGPIERDIRRYDGNEGAAYVDEQEGYYC